MPLAVTMYVRYRMTPDDHESGRKQGLLLLQWCSRVSGAESSLPVVYIPTGFCFLQQARGEHLSLMLEYNIDVSSYLLLLESEASVTTSSATLGHVSAQDGIWMAVQNRTNRI